MLHFLYWMGEHKLRIQPAHQGSIFKQIGKAGGGSQIIFQHQILALIITNQVDSGSSNIYIVWNVQMHHLIAKIFIRHDQTSGDDAFFYNLLAMINIV
ncbi:hypothetical protein D3C73_1364430 [compost metagenome]